MYILAIDGSTKSTGVAIFNDTSLIMYACLTAKGTDPLNRIEKMVEDVDKIQLQYPIEKIIIEDVIPDDVHHNHNIFKSLIYLQAAFVLNFHKQNLPVDFYVASEWRKKCGIVTGRYKKREELKQDSINFVKNKYNIDINDDTADAICIGWAYVNDQPKEINF